MLVNCLVAQPRSEPDLLNGQLERDIGKERIDQRFEGGLDFEEILTSSRCCNSTNGLGLLREIAKLIIRPPPSSKPA